MVSVSFYLSLNLKIMTEVNLLKTRSRSFYSPTRILSTQVSALYCMSCHVAYKANKCIGRINREQLTEITNLS